MVVHVVADAAALEAQPDPHTSGERQSWTITPDMTLAEALAPDPEPGIPVVRLPAAYLTGGGTLPASMVAELIRDGAKVQPLHHPADAPPEPGYRPSAQLERFIRCRDITAAFPAAIDPPSSPISTTPSRTRSGRPTPRTSNAYAENTIF
ncbi:hypothetical protein A5787_03610 [Mycobacterium sp. 852002-50816_SCH5313054-b]|nr:hypothetical protein A5787_03610 [Mycobacterium sp. 852002-50816_SCH5313054-b]